MTFTSSSFNSSVANKFTDNGRNNDGMCIYIFHVNPGTQSLYINGYEKELLINPYQQYVYIGTGQILDIDIDTDTEENSSENKINALNPPHIYHYAIYPYMVSIPDTYDDFSEFKSILEMKKNQMDGGKFIKTPNRTRRRKTHIIKKHNVKKHNVKKIETCKNRNKTVIKQLTPMEQFKERMNLPIISSELKMLLSEKQKKDIKRIQKQYGLIVENKEEHLMTEEEIKRATEFDNKYSR
jgi:hypothetical protein